MVRVIVQESSIDIDARDSPAIRGAQGRLQFPLVAFPYIAHVHYRCGSNFADAADRGPPVTSNVVHQNVGFPIFYQGKIVGHDTFVHVLWGRLSVGYQDSTEKPVGLK